MQILVTDVIDAALVIGVVALFLFVDIIAKHRLKVDIVGVSADLAIAALVIQLAFIANLLTSQEIQHLNGNILLALCFGAFWVVCLWLPTRKDVLADMFSYTLSIFALSISLMHALSISGFMGMVLVIAASIILSVIAFLFADNLKNESIKERFSEITKELNIYEMNESYRKLESGVSKLDPLQHLVDIVRGAVRNSDNFTAIQGIRCLSDLGSDIISKGGNISLIVRHVNSHLYDLGILAEEEKNREMIMEVVEAFGSMCSSSAGKGMEGLTLQCVENMNDFFDLHRESNHFLPRDRFKLIEKAGSTAELFNVLKRNPVSTPGHRIAIECGRIGKLALEQGMPEPVEKIITMLKMESLDAIPRKDMQTLEYVRNVFQELAPGMKDSGFGTLEKQTIVALRDICVKTVQENADDKDFTQRMISVLRDMGEIFGKGSYQDVIGSLRDIGVVAARKHEDNKVALIIPHMEHFCMLSVEKELDDMAALAVDAIVEVSEAAIREKMSEATVASSKALARLSCIEEVGIFVNDAVFELGKYRQIDPDMFTLFEKNYNRAGGN